MKELVEETQEIIKEYINELKRFNSIFSNYINFLIDNYNAYSKINNNILNSLNNFDFINYHTIKNIYYICDLNKIIKRSMNDFLYSSFRNKNKLILDLYEKKKSELIITYKNLEKIKLFDKSFVNNNKYNCYLLINNKKMELCEYYLNQEKNEENEITVKLIKEKILKDISCMFF